MRLVNGGQEKEMYLLREVGGSGGRVLREKHRELARL